MDKSESQRYANFYSRVRNRMDMEKATKDKEYLKQELIKFKEESINDNSIELTPEEIEQLIQQLDESEVPEDNKLDEMLDYLKNNTYGCFSSKILDDDIKIMGKRLAEDRYFKLNAICNQVEKELESNKSTDNFEEIQKIEVEKQMCSDWYDKRIAELEEELRNLDNPSIVHCGKNTGNISSLGMEVLELMDDLQVDIEEGNNITNDLNYLIDSLTKWRIELNEKVLYTIRAYQ